MLPHTPICTSSTGLDPKGLSTQAEGIYPKIPNIEPYILYVGVLLPLWVWSYFDQHRSLVLQPHSPQPQGFNWASDTGARKDHINTRILLSEGDYSNHGLQDLYAYVVSWAPENPGLYHQLEFPICGRVAVCRLPATGAFQIQAAAAGRRLLLGHMTWRSVGTYPESPL